MPIDQLLKALADALRIAPLGTAKPEVGIPMSFGLTPTLPPVLDILEAGDVSAIWLTKDVRFADALGVPATTTLSAYLTDTAKIFGGQPVADISYTKVIAPPFTDVSIPRTESTPPNDPKNDLMAGTPGVLGKLAGALPIPLQVPISVEVKWALKRTDGAPLIEGKHFVAPKGLGVPALELVFFLTGEVAEMVPEASPIVEVTLEAFVKVRAAGVDSGEVPVPAITIPVPMRLLIPTVVALFGLSNYRVLGDEGGKNHPGTVLLAVRGSSVIKSVADLAGVLDRLRDLLKRIQSFKADALSANLVTFLLGLDTLIGALDAQPRFQLDVGDTRNLGDIIFAESSWRVFPPKMGAEVNADDKASAVFVLGAPLSGVELFGDKEHEFGTTHKFKLDLYTGGAFWAEIRSLIGVTVEDDIVVFPARGEPHVGTLVFLHPPSGWGADIDNKISSLRFNTYQLPPA